MKKIISLLCLSAASSFYSQVGINTAAPKSTLDLHKSAATSAEGFLTVRLSGNELVSRDNLYGADQNSAVVYVTTAPGMSTPKTVNVTAPGFYYYNNSISKWIGLSMPKFFYMPSILFDTTTLGAKTKDLYQLYYDQFTAPQVSSTGASGKIPVLDKNDLEYYITYYDSSVFTNVTIDATGILNYTISNNATEASFMNIVFVVK